VSLNTLSQQLNSLDVESDDAFSKLANLANQAVDYLGAIQINRTIDRLVNKPNAVKLAVLSSATCDHLVPGIRLAALRRGLLIEIYCGQYGQYRHEIMQPPSSLRAFAPEYILLSLHADSLLGQISPASSPDEVDAILNLQVESLIQLWSQAKANFGVSVVQQSFLDTAPPLFGNLDRMQSASPFQRVQVLNQKLAEAAHREQTGLLDVSKASRQKGLTHWFDRARWLQAKMEIAPAAALDFGELMAQYLNAQLGKARKCLVLDLDNTLWGGVIGDDGLDGIILGQGTAVGEAHLFIQSYAKSLKERGIVLAVCSKNEEKIARAAFTDHPDMVLSLDDIAVFIANWQDKAVNLQTIATTLNIGLASLVFLDDNPAERERIRTALPMVAVPEVGDDPTYFVDVLAGQGYFEAATFTQEDMQRAAHYSANSKRQMSMETAVTIDDYLADLSMQMMHGPVSQLELPRATQLMAKTNQFNTTTRRYSQEEIAAFADDLSCISFQARLQDKFGDNGLVSVALLASSSADSKTLVIENWIMSCRVFGRNLEGAIMNLLVAQSLELGAEHLRAEFIPTAKNGVIENLFATLGFHLQSTSTTETQIWEISLADYQLIPTYISVKENT